MSEQSGSWTTVEIAGKTADVFEPERPADSRGVVYLHGHGLQTLKGNAVYSAALNRCGLRTVCPHGERSWWTDVVCPEFDSAVSPLQYLQESVVPYYRERWGVSPPHIGLFGASMGGQGVLQLAYRRPRDFPVVAAISPAVDFQNLHGRGLPLDGMFPDREAARQATAILQMHPLNPPRSQLIVCDPTDVEWFESAERLTMKLSSMGLPYEADLETLAGGHTWRYLNHMADRVVDFLADGLEQQLRREDADGG